MADLTNYGSLLKISGSAIAGLVKIKPPKISTEWISYHTQDSPEEKKIWAGTYSVEDLNATFSATSAVFLQLRNYITSGSRVDYVLYTPQFDLTFTAGTVSVEPGEADANSPDLMQFDAVFALTSASIVLS